MHSFVQLLSNDVGESDCERKKNRRHPRPFIPCIPVGNGWGAYRTGACATIHTRAYVPNSLF